MARINFDDDVESQDEFRALLPLVGGDWDLALGKLVRFFRVAQKRFGKGQPITRDELEKKGLLMMIESGWAIERDGGYQAKGADKHFKWYIQKVEAGRAGSQLGVDAREKNRARDSLKRAVDRGDVYKPTVCSRCGEEKHLEGHHEDYSKPLEVLWLCIACHEMRHHRPSEFATRPGTVGSRPSPSATPPSPALAPSPAIEKKATASQLIETWQKHRGTLPAVIDTQLSPVRAEKVSTALRQKPDMGYWLMVIVRMMASDYLTGRNGKRNPAGFDFMVERHGEILEGKYDNAPVQTDKPAALKPPEACQGCQNGLIKAMSKSSGVGEWTSCGCALGRTKTSYTRFDESKFERIGAA